MGTGIATFKELCLDTHSAPDQDVTALGPVPEPRTVKQRVHLDVSARDLAEVLDLGATVLRPQGGDIRWTVMADPEGNEFCVFPAR